LGFKAEWAQPKGILEWRSMCKNSTDWVLECERTYAPPKSLFTGVAALGAKFGSQLQTSKKGILGFFFGE
jgi:hypothetical protein